MIYVKQIILAFLCLLLLKIIIFFCCIIILVSVAYYSFNRRGPSRYKFQAFFELENVAAANVTSGDGV